MNSGLAFVSIIALAGVCVLFWRSPRARRQAAAAWSTALDLARCRVAHRMCRIRRVWRVTPNVPCPPLRLELSRCMAEAASIGILDVTGFDLIGKGPGPNGSLLYDVLSNWNKVPVSLLLLDPFSSAVDPDRSIVSVPQEVLAEMDLSDRSYRRRLRATLDAIDDLNDHRSDDAKIQIRLYSEKPTMTAVLLEKAAFVSPWEPIERERTFALFEAAEVGSSFFEIHRRLFIRLWSEAQPMAQEIAALLREGSQAVPKDSPFANAIRARVRSALEEVVFRGMGTALSPSGTSGSAARVAAVARPG